jgi:hypothetical protein
VKSWTPQSLKQPVVQSKYLLFKVCMLSQVILWKWASMFQTNRSRKKQGNWLFGFNFVGNGRKILLTTKGQILLHYGEGKLSQISLICEVTFTGQRLIILLLDWKSSSYRFWKDAHNFSNNPQFTKTMSDTCASGCFTYGYFVRFNFVGRPLYWTSRCFQTFGNRRNWKQASDLLWGTQYSVILR